MLAQLSSPRDCVLCRSNGLFAGEIIATCANAYLTTAKSNPDNFLIIPEAHIESLTDLPDKWWMDLKALLVKIPRLPSSYNLSINVGQDAGQTQKHLHFWVVPRAAGQRASGKGLASLIDEANK